MTNKLKKFILICLFLFVTSYSAFASLSSSTLETKRKMRTINARRLCLSSLTGSDLPIYLTAYSSLCQNTDTPATNEKLSELIANFDLKESTAAESLEKLEKQIDWWLRVYYMFSANSSFYPGRIQDNLAGKIEEIMFTYASVMSKSDELKGELIWSIEGNRSETISRWIRVYLCIDAVNDLQRFKAINLADGKSIEYHYTLWTEFLKMFCVEHCKYGLFPEVFSSPEGADLMISFFNIYDFADDQDIRRKFDFLSVLIWADWAHLECNNVRAGARTGVNLKYVDKYCWSDRWSAIAAPFVGENSEWIEPKNYNSLDDFAIYVAATTSYKFSDVVMIAAIDAKSRESFVSVCSYPAELMEAEDSLFIKKNGKRFLSYSYVTNYYTQSSVISSPEVLSKSESILSDKVADESYFVKSATEGVFQGILFDNSPGDVIYPACKYSGNEITDYNTLIAAQSQNITIYYPNPLKAPDGFVELLFSSGLASRANEYNGWLIFDVGNVWVAVKGISIKRPGAVHKGSWVDGNRLIFDGESGPVVLVTALGYKYKTVDLFHSYLDSHFAIVDGKTLNYYGVDALAGPAKIIIDTDSTSMPLINGERANLNSEYIYNSPIISAKMGVGTYNLSKEAKRMIVDTVKDIVSEN